MPLISPGEGKKPKGETILDKESHRLQADWLLSHRVHPAWKQSHFVVANSTYEACLLMNFGLEKCSVQGLGLGKYQAVLLCTSAVSHTSRTRLIQESKSALCKGGLLMVTHPAKPNLLLGPALLEAYNLGQSHPARRTGVLPARTLCFETTHCPFLVAEQSIVPPFSASASSEATTNLHDCSSQESKPTLQNGPPSHQPFYPFLCLRLQQSLDQVLCSSQQNKSRLFSHLCRLA